jgi:retron-type reverse transcriptase
MLPSDLRPITLVNEFCKIAEALFSSRIEEGLQRINYFSTNQFGFSKGKSTVNAIDQLVNNIKKVKKHKYAIVIAFDASSAFDTLSWCKVINNLIKTNVDTSFLKMIQSLLIERQIDLDNVIYKTETGCRQSTDLENRFQRLIDKPQ